MLAFPPSVRIYLAAGPTDMRESFDGLAAATRQITVRARGGDCSDMPVPVLVLGAQHGAPDASRADEACGRYDRVVEEGLRE